MKLNKTAVVTITMICLLGANGAYAAKEKFERTKPHAASTEIGKLQAEKKPQRSWTTVCIESAQDQGASWTEALEICGVITTE